MRALNLPGTSMRGYALLKCWDEGMSAEDRAALLLTVNPLDAPDLMPAGAVREYRQPDGWTVVQVRARRGAR